MDEAELKTRTKKFGLRCINLAESLPKTDTGRIVSNQLIRCSTSVGANYRAACRGRSAAEFVAKLGNVEEELDESAYWMEIIVDTGMKPLKLVEPLSEEADELLRIVVSSIKSTRPAIRNPKSKIQNR
jgi:four helix bundle protein